MRGEPACARSKSSKSSKSIAASIRPVDGFNRWMKAPVCSTYHCEDPWMRTRLQGSCKLHARRACLCAQQEQQEQQEHRGFDLTR